MMNNIFKIFSWKWFSGEIIFYFLTVISLLGNENMDDSLIPELGNWRYLLFPLIGIIIAFSWRFVTTFLMAKVQVDTSRNILDSELYEIIKNTKKRLWSASIAGRSFIELKDRNKLFKDLIEKDVDIKIIVCDPESKFVEYREQSEDGYSSNRIQDRIRGTLTMFRSLIKQLGEDSNEKIKIRTHANGELNNSILISDNKIYVVQYLYKTNGKNCPVLKIDQYKYNELFEIFKNKFSELWSDAKVPTENMFHEVREEPHFGEKTEIKSIALYAAFDADKLLLIKRKKSPRKGYYSFVGGHSFMDELLMETLKREVREEIKCETYQESLKLIRAIGKDNSSLSDEYFFGEENFDLDVIKGIKIKKESRKTNELSLTEHGVTIYNLFQGQLHGKPQLSNEVDEVKWETIDHWIELFEGREIKIQPIDYLLLKVLKNDK